MNTPLTAILCLICTSFAGNIIGQEKQGQQLIDSLLNELPKAQEDTSKVILLSKISFRYSTINTNEGLKFGQQALELSKKLKWKMGEARSYNCIGLNYSTRNNYKLAIKNFTMARKIYQKAKYKPGLAVCHRNLANAYCDENAYAKGMEEHLESLRLYTEMCNMEGISAELNNIALIYNYIHDYDAALKCFKRSASIHLKNNNRRDLAISLNNCSYTYARKYQFDSAITYAREALKVSLQIRDRYCLALSYKNIGVVYLEKKEFAAALGYFKQSLNYAREVSSELRIEQALGYIGLTYLDMAQDSALEEAYSKKRILLIDSAKYFLDSAIILGNSINELYFTMSCHDGLHTIYTLKKDSVEAQKEKAKSENNFSEYYPIKGREKLFEISRENKDLFNHQCSR